MLSLSRHNRRSTKVEERKRERREHNNEAIISSSSCTIRTALFRNWAWIIQRRVNADKWCKVEWVLRPIGGSEEEDLEWRVIFCDITENGRESGWWKDELVYDISGRNLLSILQQSHLSIFFWELRNVLQRTL